MQIFHCFEIYEAQSKNSGCSTTGSGEGGQEKPRNRMQGKEGADNSIRHAEMLALTERFA